MANKLDKELQSLVQRSGTNTGRMRTEAERASFSANVRKDIASIVYQLNVVYKELVKTLSSADGLNALDFGLSGNVIFTHVNATEADAEAYYSVDQARARTIKETIDVLLAEIARLENELQAALDTQEYDDSEIRSLISTNGLDLLQLAADTMGSNYTLDGDGLPNLTYSVSQAIDAIGAFFSGYPGTGNTYTSPYPTLSLNVLLSQITIDTTLDQSVIAGLSDDLSYIRTFIGMDTTGPETPVYAAHAPNVFISNGWSLEQAIAVLDSQLGAHAGRHESGGADELDGDRLDIDYIPVNYTSTTLPIANQTVHLTAHLKGIDDALGTGGTLQDAYTAGAAGTAGDIQLTNALGEIQILDDTVSPLGVTFRWIDSASAEKGHLSDTGVVLSNDAYYQLSSLSSDPGSLGGQGIYNARPDLATAKVEAYFQNSDIADANAQITRNGIVKELEVGHNDLKANDFKKFSAAAGPVLVTEEYGPAPNDMVIQTLDFDDQAQEEAYATVIIPTDEQGNRPTRYRATAVFITKPNGGAYPGGTGIAFGIKVPDNVNKGTRGNNTLVNPQWQPYDVRTQVGMDATWVNKYVVMEFSLNTLVSNNSGVLPIKIARLVGDPNDSWGADIGLHAIKVVWYR